MILLFEEEEGNIAGNDMASPRKNKRGRNKVLIDVINGVGLDIKYQKKFSALKTYKLVQQRADEGLAYLCNYVDIMMWKK